MKRINGYIDINFYNMIKIVDKDRKQFFLEYRGKKYFFKSGSLLENYTELFCSIIAKKVNISTVNYDLAFYDGNYGVVSEDYNPENLKVIPIQDILFKYYDEVIVPNYKDFPLEVFVENAFNLEDVWESINYYYKNFLITENLMKSIIESFILQIIIGNKDMHMRNISIFDTDNPMLTPNYDYGASETVNLKDNQHFYNLQVQPLNFNEKNSAVLTFEKFLNLSDYQTVEMFKEKIQLAPLADEVFQEIESMTQMSVPLEIKKYLAGIYNSNIRFINDKINDRLKR